MPLTLDTREWFNEGTYSDLTIKLSDGTDVKVHKIIVCRVNEYFRKLCGSESHFAVSCVSLSADCGNANVAYQESKQAVVELKEDDATALAVVLSHIYKLPVIDAVASTGTWRHWINLRTTADKYLESELSISADKKFRAVAFASEESDEIFDIIEMINNEMAHDESLVALGDKMRGENLQKLLKNDRFRANLESGGTAALWQVIDDLSFAAGLKERRHHLCASHETQVFLPPRGDKSGVGLCPLCQAQTSQFNRSSYADYSGGAFQSGRAAWI